MRSILLGLSFLCAVANADLYTEIHGNGVYTVSERSQARRKVERIKKQVDEGGFLRLAELSDNALGAIFEIAIKNLKRRGYHDTANQIKNDWLLHKGTLIVMALDMHTQERPIGDYEPLSDFLAQAYDAIEEKLGYELCRILRLSDLKTLNYGLRVVFAPCRYGKWEFQNHFVHDDKYRGVFPVVVYWTVSLSCSAATFGAGYFFICSPIALLCEAGADRYVAPWLSEKLYSLVCD